MPRDAVLAALRQNLPQSSPLPDVSAHAAEWIRYDDPVEQFRQTLESVGGDFVVAADRAEADAAIRGLPAFEGEVRVSRVDGVGETTFDYDSLTDPHELAHVELAVMPGHFLVAENACCWVTCQTVCDRVAHFLTQHLALVVEGPMLHNMHEAYERIDPRAQPFSIFISGPSKTADIEQSLVIGAHGSRSLTVVWIPTAGDSD